MADAKEESIGSAVDGNIGGGTSRGSLLARPRLVAVASSAADSLNRPPSTGTFHVDTSNIFNSTKSVLRPSQLKAPFPSSNLSGEGGGASCNPFLPSSSAPAPSNASASSTETDHNRENKATDKKADDAPKFVPLHSSRDGIGFAGGSASRASPSGLTRASGFVFGQNLQDRIVKQSDEESGEGQGPSGAAPPATNGTSASHLLFSAAAHSHSAKEETSGTLAESAEAWERARDAPQPPAHPPGPIFTGEEEETNVLQVNCRLFAFEGGVWKERGRGQLRLNDGASSSRLVCRAAGSLRVLLNTKVFADMKEEKAGSKSLRVTATDSKQQLKVFLIMASPEEINQLHKYLSRRVALAKKSEESCAADVPPPLPAHGESDGLFGLRDSAAHNSEKQEEAVESPSPSPPAEDEESRGSLKRPFAPSPPCDEAKKPCTDAHQL